MAPDRDVASPPVYERRTLDGRVLVAVPDVCAPLAERLRSHPTLYAWAATQPQPRALQGRGVVYVADMPEAGATVAVRHAWHGGLLAPITGDRFFVPTRAPREAAASVTLRERGIPTPEVLAYALYPAGPGLRRVDVCTRFVHEAWDFGAVLAALAPSTTREAAEQAVLTLLRQLARAGVVHPDLNVKNILLAPPTGRGATGAPHIAWLLDVDIVQFLGAPAPVIMQRNLARLTRSIRKWHDRHTLPLDERWLTEFSVRALTGAT